MPRRFFELCDDVEFPGRWHLGTPVDGTGLKLESERFTNGRPVSIEGRLKVPVEQRGTPLDFSEAGIGVAVVHVKAAALFAELAPEDVQLIPVEVEGRPEEYSILVATRLIPCINEELSGVRFWTPEHGIPEMVGQYISIDDLHIDEARAGSAKVFRPDGWEVALIISHELKEALEHLGCTGVRFKPV
ncbi:imm11 family protein [Hyalangium versicolor]|uniref:imm11 family protein n=1 Tax=Hyalangium versicolor TaxID=2861190 RepID=UPI001CCF59CB|nr:DUF1629 domain-containing protein [Hyalangium versicolor]